MTSRLSKILDAVSQLCNVAFLPNHQDTNANESISGRAHRASWRTAERLIDIILWWDHPHCKNAYERDVQRAREVVEKNG